MTEIKHCITKTLWYTINIFIDFNLPLYGLSNTKTNSWNKILYIRTSIYYKGHATSLLKKYVKTNGITRACLNSDDYMINAAVLDNTKMP
jgi:predicted hydrolase (HD superfamily)